MALITSDCVTADAARLVDFATPSRPGRHYLLQHAAARTLRIPCNKLLGHWCGADVFGLFRHPHARLGHPMQTAV